MKNTINKFIVLAVVLANVSFAIPSSVLAHDDNNHPEPVPYCINGGELTAENAARAHADGLIYFQLEVSSDKTKAELFVKNKTNCILPISLSSYKMYDKTLSNQKFFDGTNLVHATRSTLISVKLPNCMAQIDAWFGLHPQTLLDSNPYAYPNVPFVFTNKFIYNDGAGYADASGKFCVDEMKNEAPVITINGSNPVEVTVGNTYLDLGATASDLEDGDITSKIVATSTVNTNVVGTYSVKYNVVDSKGLAAIEAVRVVKVSEAPKANKGKITFCLVVANTENVIATSSAGLPAGVLTTKLGTTTTDIASSTFFQTKSWNTSAFTPNNRAILTVNDSDCITYDNLAMGIYTYTDIATSTAWDIVKYNDQDTQPVNNVFDFFGYSDTDTNSDGYIVLDSYRYERTLYVLAKYNSAPQCLIPSITSSLTASVTVNTAFSYTLTASSTTDILGVSTTTLPAWLSFATSTNTLSGTATTTGTYNVDLKAVNSCGFDSKTLVITVSNQTGGGGGGGPSSDIEVSKITDKSTVNPGDTVTYTVVVVNKGPNDTTGVNLIDNLPGGLTFVSATTTVGSYATSTGIWTIGSLGNNASTTLTLVATINAGTHGQKISNTAVASSTLSDPTSGNNTSTADVQVNPAPTTAGGCTVNCGGGGSVPANGPISTNVPSNGPIVAPSAPTSPTANSCYYLYDYLRKDFNNNPVEVKKLQVFLRDLEGFSTVQVTGIYDDQTIVALDAFQERYKSDILTPWGHTEATSYTYILTKKKVNEIYCKMAFPVTPSQQVEIDSYRAFLQGLKDAGIDISVPQIPGGSITPINPSLPEVGKSTTTPKGGIFGTLAGVSSTTEGIISNLTANVFSAGKRFLSSALGYFTGPFKMFGNKAEQCITSFTGLGWLNYILILVILILSYLWYREHTNNKSLDEINKEIDLNK